MQGVRATAAIAEQMVRLVRPATPDFRVILGHRDTLDIPVHPAIPAIRPRLVSVDTRVQEFPVTQRTRALAAITVVAAFQVTLVPERLASQATRVRAVSRPILVSVPIRDCLASAVTLPLLVLADTRLFRVFLDTVGQVRLVSRDIPV